MKSISDDWVTIVVSDNGAGIADDDIGNVMLPFVQADSGWTSTDEGAGLGLPLVENLVVAHNGEFELKSELGVGTDAIVKFPRSRMIEVSTLPS